MLRQTLNALRENGDGEGVSSSPVDYETWGSVVVSAPAKTILVHFVPEKLP